MELINSIFYVGQENCEKEIITGDNEEMQLQNMGNPAQPLAASLSSNPSANKWHNILPTHHNAPSKIFTVESGNSKMDFVTNLFY